MRSRRLARIFLIVLAALGTLVISTRPASAHPTLLSTAPQAGYAVAASPKMITLVFDEPVTVNPHGVQLVDTTNNAIKTGDVAGDPQGRRLTIRVQEVLAPGRYVVRWHLTAQDGDAVDSEFDFAVGTNSAALQGKRAATTTGYPLVVALRWLLFVALAGVLGGWAAECLTNWVTPTARRPRSSMRPAALLGVAAALGLLAHVLITTGPGLAVWPLGLEALAFVGVAVVAQRGRWWLPAAPGLLAVSAEAVRSHLGSQHAAAGALVLGAHLLAAAIWVGAIVHLLRVMLINRGGKSPVRRLFAVYARLAVSLVLIVGASGTLSAVLLVQHVSGLVLTSYGRVLAVKLTLVLLAIGLAFVARRRLRRPRTLDAAVNALARISPLLRAEALTLVAVLAITAALVSLPTPAPATKDLGYPLPVVGPALRVGALVGQVAVAVTASENQLEVRLRVPDATVDLVEAEPPTFDVTAKVHDAGDTPYTVPLLPCGRGCFIGPVRWSSGSQDLELRVEVPKWNGGTTKIPITWPTRSTEGMLPRIIAAMRALPSFQVTELATSDTSRPAPPAIEVTTTPDELLDSEPYGDTPSLATTILPARSGRKLLAIALPAEGVYIQLEIDSHYRITRETLDEPAHHIERHFVYPQ
jgi:copper transport protein